MRASKASVAETGAVTAFEVDRRGFDVEVVHDDGTELEVEVNRSFEIERTERG